MTEAERQAFLAANPDRDEWVARTMASEPTAADFAVAAFREQAIWLRENMAFWAPEIFEGRWQGWIEKTAVSIRDATAHTGRSVTTQAAAHPKEI